MTTRGDSWLWGIRLTKTRSAAGAACRAGHVQINGVTAKPATPVSIGDRVRVRLHGRERDVEVTKLISKRASAAVAADCYIDHSPPPPPREVVAAIPRREPGAGRPTKRERRQMDRLRGGMLPLIAVLALILTGCGTGGDDPTTETTKTPKAGTGPDFDRCGGLTLDDVKKATGFAGLEQFIDNPSVCEWRTGDVRQGAVVSWNWYRGSPIGRERGHEQLSRDLTEDYELDGHPGFFAKHDTVCEIGIQFGADFIEMSGRYDPRERGASLDRTCDAVEELTKQSVGSAK